MALLGRSCSRTRRDLRQRGPFPAEVDELVEEDARQGRRAAGRSSTRAHSSRSSSGSRPPARARTRRRAGVESPRSLTPVEQRLVTCRVVMASWRRPISRSCRVTAARSRPRERPTLAPPAPPRRRSRRAGAKVERLADGSLVATLVGEGDATDHAAHAARFRFRAARGDAPRPTSCWPPAAAWSQGASPWARSSNSRASRLLRRTGLAAPEPTPLRPAASRPRRPSPQASWTCALRSSRRRRCRAVAARRNRATSRDRCWGDPRPASAATEIFARSRPRSTSARAARWHAPCC